MKFRIFEERAGGKGEDLLGGAVGLENSHMVNAISLGYDFRRLNVGQSAAALLTQGKSETYVIVERVE